MPRVSYRTVEVAYHRVILAADALREASPAKLARLSRRMPAEIEQAQRQAVIDATWRHDPCGARGNIGPTQYMQERGL